MFAAFLCLLEDAPGKVIFMPARHNEDDTPTRSKAGEQRCTVLVPDALANGLGFCLFAVLDNVVNEEEVCTFTGDAAAKADGNHAARMSLDVPVRFAAVRTIKSDAEKSLTKIRDLLPITIAELLCKVRAVTDLDDAPIGIASKKPRGKCLRCGLRFSMSRRHEDHEAINLSALDGLEFLADKMQMSAWLPSAMMRILAIRLIALAVFLKLRAVRLIPDEFF